MPSLADIARAAGVSTSTASRALSRPQMVTPVVVERVRRLASELGYSANPFARSLRMQQSKTLGLIVPDSTNPFFAEVARGIEAACYRAGYTLILCNSDRSLEKEAAQARVLAGKRVDGVLLFSISDASAGTIEWLRTRGTPVVLVERRPPVWRAADGSSVVRGRRLAVDCIVSDNRSGVRQALEHLAALGHRRIACLAGEPAASHYAERIAAYRHAATALGLVTDAALVQTGLVTYADGQAAARDMLAKAPPPTALFCTTDTLAIGALRGIHAAGKRVPEDMAVIGYGNTELTAYTEPPLTSVGQERLAVGARAVRILLRRLAPAPEATPLAALKPQTCVIPTRLVVRASTTGIPATASPAADEHLAQSRLEAKEKPHAEAD